MSRHCGHRNPRAGIGLKQHMVFLLSCDNWESVELMDNFFFIYDRMPRKMRLIIDLKIKGMSNKVIARKVRCSVSSVCNHIRKAKKRILRGENIL